MSVASKNLFALLGNTDDGDETPSGPVKTVDKNSTRTTKRNVEPQAPSKPATASAGGNRRGGLGGSEGAFRDRDAGSANNYRKPTDENFRGGARGGRGARDRGGRGGRFPRDRDDRHTKNVTPGGGSDKQAAQSWGATAGEAEMKDEQAGEEIAQTEQKEAIAEDAQEDATPAEPEDKSVSYADYLAQQAEKKLALGNLEIRKPDEGSKKWANAKPLSKEDSDDFISGSGGKSKREREKKTKQIVDIDQRYVEPERSTRGGPRGGGRGGPRGGGGRGEGGPRGGRGGRGGPRGGGRGEGRGDSSAAINTADKSAFPSLGK